jgi:MFS family permease
MQLIFKGITAPAAASSARALRDFADGFAAILLPVYMAALGYDAAQIGFAATLALLGSAIFTLGVGWLGSRIGDRSTLLAASSMMVATGIAFAFATDYAAILMVSLFGTLNPSSGNASIFVPAEHSIMSHGVAASDRTRAFARYGLIGAMAAAFGSLMTRVPDMLTGSVLAGGTIDRLTALRGMFLLYGAIGVAVGLVYANASLPRMSETTQQKGMLGPSRNTVFKLMALFSLDSFAGGLIVQSLLALYLFQRFDLSLVAAGNFFFWSGVMSAFSQPASAWLAQRIGLVNTMVFTHIPANVFLILGALSPRLDVAMGLLLARAFLSQMDVPARSSYVMAVVTPPERTAAASLTALPRSLAAAAAPALSGLLLAGGLTAWPLVLGGGLKIVYDLMLLWMFRHVKPPEEMGK